MVVYFSEQDLVSFGNFMISEERIEAYNKDQKLTDEELDVLKKEVVRGDLELWVDLTNKNG